MILALESSCDETAAAISDAQGNILASAIASQIEIHRAFGGVVPEVASRNHTLHARALVEEVLKQAGLRLADIHGFAATAGPGLVSSLLVGSSLAKGLALGCGKPFVAVNHLEGHLLSPFMETPRGPQPHAALIASGGHSLLIDMRAVGDYRLLGRSRDDAAGEAFDKIAKMLGLPYPGGPELERAARGGDAHRFALPRAFMEAGSLEFSFSGLKTAVLYELPKLDLSQPQTLADLCASVQEAIIEVLCNKLIRAARECRHQLVSLSGGVSCNQALRQRLQQECSAAGLELLLCQSRYSTDNAAMIAYAAAQHLGLGHHHDLATEVHPNLPLCAGFEQRA